MGQYIYDLKNKGNWLRMGTNILNYSAICVWDGVLVLGSGANDKVEAQYANLVFADWGKKTELGSQDGVGDWATNTITSKWETKNFDFGLPTVQKQIRRIAIVYRNNSDWGASQTLKLYYSLDQGSWTAISTSISASNSDDKTTRHVAGRISNEFYNIRFKIESDDFFEVLKMVVSYHIHAIKEE